MITRVNELKTALRKNGWEVKHQPADDLPWWLDEVWELNSTWSPVGFKAFVCFMFDPQHDGPRKKGQQVWCVEACQSMPSERLRADGGPVASFKSRRERWRLEVQELIAHLDEWRDLSKTKLWASSSKSTET